jgi:hypothetical protein
MPLSLSESQTIKKITQLLYSFLPGSPHPYADQSIPFPGVARSLGLSHLWRDGSKLSAITMFLEKTIETRRERFCDLVLEVVRKGLIYRNNKGDPITREEIRELNELILRVHFKIPELWDPVFLDSLPSVHKKVEEEVDEATVRQAALNKLKDDLIKLTDLEPKPRGFAFERLLK